MNNCVIYPRFSSHGQNEQSIEAQVKICKEFAEKRGLTVVNIYPEKARTGTNDARPAFQRMIADSSSGAFQYIIVYMFDRFARNRRDSIMYKEMLREKNNIKVLSALEPIAEDEGGEFYEMFLEWNAEKYSKRLSKRVRDGLDISVSNGVYCGGYLIYGYKIELEPILGRLNKSLKKVVINPEEAEIIRYIFEQYDKGVPKKDIAETLNKQGHRLNGKPFIGKSFDRWLNNAKYTGEFSFGGRTCDNMYPAIINKLLFKRVQKRLNKNRYFAGGVATAKVPYILTGKLNCYHCGTDMVSDGGTSKQGIQHLYYTCKQKKKGNCDKRREHKEALEQIIFSNVVEYLVDNKNLEMIINDVLSYYEKKSETNKLKSIERRITVAQNEVNELAEAFVKAKSTLLQNSIEQKMVNYEKLLDDLSLQRAQLELERGNKLSKEDIKEFVLELLRSNKSDKEYRRLIIDNLVSQVYISDEYIVVYFNIKATKAVEHISLEDTNIALTSIKEFRTQPPLARQVVPN